MAHAPALIRTNTAPVFPANSNYGPSSSVAATMSSLRSSHLSGSTAVNSASTTSLASMTSAATVVAPMNGVMATANIINQRADASRSLYQICVSLKQRLAKVPGFEGFLEVIERDALSSEYNPVESLWDVLRTGEPLLTIYNSFKPAVPLNPGDLPKDPARRPKAATFKFIDACLRQIQIPATDCFIVSDLMNNDTTGFVKVSLCLESCFPFQYPLRPAVYRVMLTSLLGYSSNQPCS